MLFYVIVAESMPPQSSYGDKIEDELVQASFNDLYGTCAYYVFRVKLW